MAQIKENNWNYKKSKEFYCVDGWSNSYFDIDKDGNVTVRRGKYLKDIPVAIDEIVKYACDKFSIQTPMLLRFTDIVKNRVERITKSFNKERTRLNYTPEYTLIYPVKVNQNRAVVQSVIESKANNGLEAGSKAELLAVL